MLGEQPSLAMLQVAKAIQCRGMQNFLAARIQAWPYPRQGSLHLRFCAQIEPAFTCC